MIKLSLRRRRRNAIQPHREAGDAVPCGLHRNPMGKRPAAGVVTSFAVLSHATSAPTVSTAALAFGSLTTPVAESPTGFPIGRCPGTIRFSRGSGADRLPPHVCSKRDFSPMVTPTHMILGAALFARRSRPGSLWAALAGGLLPDVPIFLMTLYATRIAGVPRGEVFGTLYFSDSWQRVFSIDHGILIWLAVCLVALWFRAGLVLTFAAAGLAHALLDFGTHSSDARPQFWPLTDWIFASPVSYWERENFSDIVNVVEVVGIVALTLWLLVRFPRWRERAAVILVAAIVLAPLAITGNPHALHGIG